MCSSKEAANTEAIASAVMDCRGIPLMLKVLEHGRSGAQALAAMTLQNCLCPNATLTGESLNKTAATSVVSCCKAQ